MTDQAAAIQDIFARRMALVGEISQLNAEQLHNSQQLSGNQIDLMRCSDRLQDQAGSAQLRDELDAAEAHAVLLQSKIADCDNRIRMLEAEIAALDRQLEDL